jgi:tRNA U55 pseudouridine synthase TruB
MTLLPLHITKEDILNVVTDDPEDLYVFKHEVELKLKEEDDTYQRKTLGQFIQDIGLNGEYIFVTPTDSIVFTIKYDKMFVTSSDNDSLDLFIETLNNLQGDLSSLKKISNVDAITEGFEMPTTYFLINKEIYSL